MRAALPLLPLLLVAVTLALTLCPALLTSARSLQATRTSSSTWSSLASDLQSEFDSGLDESALHELERSVVSQQAAKCMLQQPRRCDTSRTVRVQLEIRIDSGRSFQPPRVGVLTLDLFNSTAPLTVANFLSICEGRNGLSYRNNRFHRIITNFMAQGGDITRGDGTGGRSIYGRTFRDETFACHHVCRGSVSMANAGPNSNGSQFFLTFEATPWLDGKHVVFGQVSDGWPVLEAMEEAGTRGGKPTQRVLIQKCTVG